MPRTRAQQYSAPSSPSTPTPPSTPEWFEEARAAHSTHVLAQYQHRSTREAAHRAAVLARNPPLPRPSDKRKKKRRMNSHELDSFSDDDGEYDASRNEEEEGEEEEQHNKATGARKKQRTNSGSSSTAESPWPALHIESKQHINKVLTKYLETHDGKPLVHVVPLASTFTPLSDKKEWTKSIVLKLLEDAYDVRKSVKDVQNVTQQLKHLLLNKFQDWRPKLLELNPHYAAAIQSYHATNLTAIKEVTKKKRASQKRSSESSAMDAALVQNQSANRNAQAFHAQMLSVLARGQPGHAAVMPAMVTQGGAICLQLPDGGFEFMDYRTLAMAAAANRSTNLHTSTDSSTSMNSTANVSAAAATSSAASSPPMTLYPARVLMQQQQQQEQQQQQHQTVRNSQQYGMQDQHQQQQYGQQQQPYGLTMDAHHSSYDFNSSSAAAAAGSMQAPPPSVFASSPHSPLPPYTATTTFFTPGAADHRPSATEPLSMQHFGDHHRPNAMQTFPGHLSLQPQEVTDDHGVLRGFVQPKEMTDDHAVLRGFLQPKEATDDHAVLRGFVHQDIAGDDEEEQQQAPMLLHSPLPTRAASMDVDSISEILELETGQVLPPPALLLLPPSAFENMQEHKMQDKETPPLTLQNMQEHKMQDKETPPLTLQNMQEHAMEDKETPPLTLQNMQEHEGQEHEPPEDLKQAFAQNIQEHKMHDKDKETPTKDLKQAFAQSLAQMAAAQGKTISAATFLRCMNHPSNGDAHWQAYEPTQAELRPLHRAGFSIVSMHVGPHTECSWNMQRCVRLLPSKRAVEDAILQTIETKKNDRQVQQAMEFALENAHQRSFLDEAKPAVLEMYRGILRKQGRWGGNNEATLLALSDDPNIHNTQLWSLDLSTGRITALGIESPRTTQSVYLAFFRRHYGILLKHESMQWVFPHAKMTASPREAAQALARHLFPRRTDEDNNKDMVDLITVPETPKKAEAEEEDAPQPVQRCHSNASSSSIASTCMPNEMQPSAHNIPRTIAEEDEHRALLSPFATATAIATATAARHCVSSPEPASKSAARDCISSPEPAFKSATRDCVSSPEPAANSPEPGLKSPEAVKHAHCKLTIAWNEDVKGGMLLVACPEHETTLQSQDPYALQFAADFEHRLRNKQIAAQQVAALQFKNYFAPTKLQKLKQTNVAALKIAVLRPTKSSEELSPDLQVQHVRIFMQPVAQ